MVIVWKEELATGNEEIDNQHKEMFRRFNDFQSACKQGKGQDELSNLLTTWANMSGLTSRWKNNYK